MLKITVSNLLEGVLDEIRSNDIIIKMYWIWYAKMVLKFQWIQILT
jgi:hypothetical protein